MRQNIKFKKWQVIVAGVGSAAGIITIIIAVILSSGNYSGRNLVLQFL